MGSLLELVMHDPRVHRITYEEVIDDGTTSAGPLHNRRKVLELEWEQDHLKEGRYTLNMVKIDRKVKEVIS